MFGCVNSTIQYTYELEKVSSRSHTDSFHTSSRRQMQKRKAESTKSLKKKIINESKPVQELQRIGTRSMMGRFVNQMYQLGDGDYL